MGFIEAKTRVVLPIKRKENVQAAHKKNTPDDPRALLKVFVYRKQLFSDPRIFGADVRAENAEARAYFLHCRGNSSGVPDTEVV